MIRDLLALALIGCSSAQMVSAMLAPAPAVSTPAPTATDRPVPTAQVIAEQVADSLSVPALGISGPIRGLSECGGLLPDTGIWSWPSYCGGSNDLILLAHAYGAFAPIYRGFHSGALRVGLAAEYVDASGLGHAYLVAAVWHIDDGDLLAKVDEALSTPAITLVTCDDVGRIFVRLLP